MIYRMTYYIVNPAKIIKLMIVLIEQLSSYSLVDEKNSAVELKIFCLKNFTTHAVYYTVLSETS